MKSAIVCAVGMLLALGEAVSAVDHPRPDRQLYVWYGQFVAVDRSARVATIKARIPPHVERYVGRFKPGDRLMVVWNMIGKTEAADVLALWQLDGDTRPSASIGYVLPIEFVSSDTSSHTVTFKTSLTPQSLRSLTSVTANRWIKVRTPIVQSSQGALMTSIELTDPPETDVGTSSP